jgi:ABC-type multidrug transport system fused ATPase/permease subunit
MQDIFLGALTGAIFWGLGIEAVATRFGALYQSLLTIAFQTAACIPAYFVRRRVFYKQKNAGFFSCSSYLLASTAAASPLVLLDSVLFGTIVYWCTGFARDDHGAHFFIFLAHLTLVGWAMMSFFKLTTFLSPDLTSAAAVSGIVTFFLLLFSGFIISIKDVPPFYVWVMYLNPLFYAFQGLAVNEFIAEKYSPLLPSGKSLGETVLDQKGLFTDARWAWWGLFVNLGITLLYLTLTQLAMMRLEWLEPVNSADTTPEEAITQGSFAMRELGASRRQLNMAKAEEEGEGDIEGEGDGSDGDSTWASESIRSWSVGMGSSIGGNNISLRPFNALGDDADDYTDSAAEGNEAKEDNGSPIGPPKKKQHGSVSFASSVDGETKDAEIETGTGAGGSTRGVKFSSHISDASDEEEEVTVNVLQKMKEVVRPLMPAALTSAKLLDQLRKGKSSTWQLEAVKAIPFVPTALTFQNLWYSVPVKGNETVDLLKGVNGSVVPGCMMALMGSSGAGKTTLLDVLAGRKTGGSIRGSILVNGVALAPDVFKTISGYVEQFGSVR